MGKGHVTLKELKHDAVKDAGRSALEYLDVHRTKILVGVLAVAALILIVRLGSSMAENRRTQATRDLAKARTYYLQATRLSDSVEAEGRLDLAIEAIARLEREYGLSENGLEALYLKGNCLCQKQDYDGAIAAFQSCIDNTKTDSMRSRAYLALGYALADKAFLEPGNADLESKARQAFEEAQKLGTGPGGEISYIAADAMMNLAGMDADAGNYEQAKKTYRAVAEARSMDKDYARFKTKEDSPKTEGAEKKETTGQEDRIRMIREGMRESLTQFGFQRIAEQRLAQLEARAQAPATPEAKSK